MEILARDILRTPGGGTRVEGGMFRRPLFAGRLFVMASVITAPATRSLIRRSLEDAENDKIQAKQAGNRHQYRNEPKVH